MVAFGLSGYSNRTERVMKLKGIMSKPVLTVHEDTTLDVAAGMMLENGYGCLPVVDNENNLVGLITHSEFIAKEEGIPFSRLRILKLLGHSLQDGMEKIYETAKTMTARDIVRINPETLTEDDTVRTFLELISEKEITHVPIVKDGLVIGIVTRQDLLKMVADPSCNTLSD